jgi:hypothetical protein
MYVRTYIHTAPLHCKVTNSCGTTAIEEEAKEAYKLLVLAEEASKSLGAARTYSVLRQQALRSTAVCAIFSRQV